MLEIGKLYRLRHEMNGWTKRAGEFYGYLWVYEGTMCDDTAHKYRSLATGALVGFDVSEMEAEDAEDR